MLQSYISEKTASAFEVRRNFGKVLQNIVKGDKIIVERHGEPVAVVVPLAVYDQWKQNRTALFNTMRMSQKQANLSSKQADAIAEEAVHVIRSKKRNESSR